MQKYDAVIIGGGSAGIAAAYALSTLSLFNRSNNILLIEKEDNLGGTAVQSRVLDWIAGCHPKYFDGVYDYLVKKNAVQGNITKSWLPVKFSKSGNTNHLRIAPEELLKKYYEDLSQSIDIKMSWIYEGIDTIEDGQISEVKIRNTKTGEKEVVSARFFVDSTSSGILCRDAGAKSYHGRDGRTFKNESIALEADPRTMNEPSLMFQVKKGLNDEELLSKVKSVYVHGLKVVKPDYIIVDGYCEPYPWRTQNPQIFMCNPMTGLGLKGIDTIDAKDINAFQEEAQKRVLEYWKYIKLCSLEQFANEHKNAIGGLDGDIADYGFYQCAPMVGIRESYRIECEDMLHQGNLCQKIDFEALGDSIAIGTHPIDMHVRDGLNRDELNRINNEEIKPYGVGYKCLIPKGLKNILVVGKSFGATQIAAASARNNMFMAQIGWAAGNAIKYCLDYDIQDTRNVSADELRKGEYIDFNYYVENIKGDLK